MKILILGASGLVGSAIYKKLADVKEYEVHGTYNRNKPEDFHDVHKWDIADITGLNELLSITSPDVIISSLTGDFVQQFAAHKAIADYLKKSGGRMIFISTVNVFDGAAGGNHSEAALPYPLSQYGDFKKNCEEMLMWTLGKNCLIARLPKILSNKDAENITRHIEKGNGFYTNLFFNFNTPEKVAEAIKICIEKNKSGIAHMVGRGYMSDADWASQVLEKAGLTITYETMEMTAEKYCTALGCNDMSKLRPSDDGGFYLTMVCTDKDLTECCQ